MVTKEMISSTRSLLHDYIMTKWLAEEVFSIRWWVMVAFIVFSYILVFSILHKPQYTELILFGSLITVFSLVFSIFGSNFILWSYNIRILPITPSPVLYDLSIIPLYNMLVYQYSQNWKRFFILTSVLSGLISLVYFPFVKAMGIVSFSNNWIPAYFFPVTFTFSVIARLVVLGILKQKKQTNSTA